MCYTPITKKVIDSAKKLKAIIKYGVGIDAIDIDAAKASNIPVVNIPLYAEETVAEGAFALLIALIKKTIPIQNAMQSKGWAWPEKQWMANDIAGKTLGIIGLGRIGKNMARIAGAGFRAKVIAFNPDMSAEEMQKAGVEKYDDLHEMLKRCDFISIHCTLNPQTLNLISHSEFEVMKPSVIIVNSSRGAIINEMALLDALKQKRIGGAALDVYSIEPLDQQQHPLRELYALDNVLLSPHLTFYTQESMQRLEHETLERIDEALNAQPLMIKSTDPRLTSQKQGVVFSQS
jgi:D-3-phosphoglycerate dehydrogenase